MSLRILAAALFALAATACTTMAESDATPDAAVQSEEPRIVDRTGEGAARCPSDAYQVLVGQRIGEIDRASLPVPHRVYGRGDMVTMDYRPDRLNIVVGNDERVQEVKCG